MSGTSQRCHLGTGIIDVLSVTIRYEFGFKVGSRSWLAVLHAPAARQRGLSIGLFICRLAKSLRHCVVIHYTLLSGRVNVTARTQLRLAEIELRQLWHEFSPELDLNSRPDKATLQLPGNRRYRIKRFTLWKC